MTKAHHPGQIVLVDDDRLDAAIIRRILRDLGVTHPLVHLTDGDQALAYLRGQDGAPPCVILLDVDMPRMDGFELLQVIKADDLMRDIPVVVVTTSDEPKDRTTGRELGAAAYIIKCVDYTRFRENMRVIEKYLTAVGPQERPAMAGS